MLQRSILCMQGTQYATKRSILCRGSFCGPTHVPSGQDLGASANSEGQTNLCIRAVSLVFSSCIHNI